MWSRAGRYIKKSSISKYHHARYTQGLKFSVLGTDFSLEDSNHSFHVLTIEK